jgi:hypothetical protein
MIGIGEFLNESKGSFSFPNPFYILKLAIHPMVMEYIYPNLPRHFPGLLKLELIMAKPHKP